MIATTRALAQELTNMLNVNDWREGHNSSRVPQLTNIWMSLPGASGLGNLTTFELLNKKVASMKD